jgi:hypothetical protein
MEIIFVDSCDDKKRIMNRREKRENFSKQIFAVP